MDDLKKESAEEKKESKASLYATLSCILLILGANLPLYTAQVLSSKSNKSRVNQEGLIIILLAIIAAVFIYIKKQKYIIISSIITSYVLLHYYLLVPTLDDFLSMAYGYYIQWIAIIGMIVSVFMLPKKDIADSNNEEQTEKEEEEIGKNNEGLNIKDLKWVLGSFVVSGCLFFFLDKEIIDNAYNINVVNYSVNSDNSYSDNNDKTGDFDEADDSYNEIEDENDFDNSGQNYNNKDVQNDLSNTNKDKNVQNSKTPTSSTTPTSIPTLTPTLTPVQQITAQPAQSSTPQPTKSTFVIYFDKPEAWGDNVCVYMYSADGYPKKENKQWPGQQAKSIGNGKYSFEIENDWIGRSIMFNDGTEGNDNSSKNQYPGNNQQGLQIAKDKTYKVQ